METGLILADGLGNEADDVGNALGFTERACREISPSRWGNFRLESRVRENRLHGSEGGEANNLPYPYRLNLMVLLYWEKELNESK